TSIGEQLKRGLSRPCLIEVAESGEEALEIVDELIEQGESLAVVISDHLMPRMKGDELLRRIHARLPDARKILLTGQASADAVGGAVNHASLYRYIAKPWESADLLLTINEALKSFLQARELARKTARLERTLEVFQRFVPRDFIRQLPAADVTRLALGDGVEREMSVLFTDMRAFTSRAETMSPKQAFAFLNRYLGHAGPIVRAHRGFIVTFLGDALMAAFPGGPDDAIACSVELLARISSFNDGEGLRGDDRLRIGVGVNTGSLLIGIIGDDERWEGSAISDVANTAARIEGLTKKLGISIAASESTIAGLSSATRYAHRRIGEVFVKGRKRPVNVFEIVTAAGDAAPAT
ncbi:MAG: response regulator, partial [Myxococcales bacterium]|nr:response regulator [Myxococcales bacterium]